MIFKKIAITIVLIVNAISCVEGDHVASIVRYAYVIGSNTGSDKRAELKYAVSDAHSFASVLTEMGGVSKEHCIVTVNPNRNTLSDGFARLNQIVKQGSNGTVRKEAIVYYSGHADTSGLILGKESYSYVEMRQSLNALGVKVLVAVLDACESGSLTREKGGKHKKPFLYDVSQNIEGHAYLTSSSSSEASLESDAIKSSFFTHYLISGMRGPADADGDRTVTLNEAYKFAYDETLQRTQKTKIGPQHPTYDIRLKGSGDLVLTDLRTSGSFLRLQPKLQGRVFIYNADGYLQVELLKVSGKQFEIGLEPGTFEIVVNDGSRVFTSKVQLIKGQITELADAELYQTDQKDYRLRGTNSSATETGSYQYIPVNLSLLTPISLTGQKTRMLTNFSLSILAAKFSKLIGVDISSGASFITEKTTGAQITSLLSSSNDMDGIQISGAVNIAGGSCRGAQISGVYNKCNGSFMGTSVTGALNISGGNFYGIQTAGIINSVKGEVKGVQIASTVNFSQGKMDGLQIAGLGNDIRSNARACMISGVYNAIAGDITGMQISGVGNQAAGNITGVGIAGVVNKIAGRSTGLQIAGCVNYSKEFKGVQIGTVNTGKSMRGLTIGVVNVCDTMSGLPIALFNYVRKIPAHLRVAFDEGGFTHVIIRSGTEHLYSLISMGTTTVSKSYQWTYGAGIGGKVTLNNCNVALELMSSNIQERKFWDTFNLSHYRCALIYEHIKTGLWGGPSFNCATSSVSGKERNSYYQQRYKKIRNSYVAMWPGLVGGIDFKLAR